MKASKLVLRGMMICMVVALIAGCAATPATTAAPTTAAPATTEPATAVPATAVPSAAATTTVIPAAEITKAPMSADGNPIKIGYMGVTETSQFWKTVKDSLVYYSAKKGIELTSIITDQDPAKMSAAMDQFYMRGVDFIVDGNTIPELCAKFSKESKDHGIPYLSVDMDCGADYFFGYNNQTSGETLAAAAAKMIKDEWGGKPDLVVRISWPALGDEVMKRSSVVPEALAKDGVDMSNVEVALLELDNSSFTTEKIMQKTTDLLNSRPNAKKIVMFGIEDSSAASFVAAAENLGRGDQVMAFGVDTSDSALQSLCKDAKNSTISSFRGSVNPFVQNYGDEITDIIVRVLSGEKVDHFSYSPMELATAANIYDMFPDCTRDFFKN